MANYFHGTVGAGGDGGGEGAEVKTVAVVETARAKENGFDVPFFGMFEEGGFGVAFKDVGMGVEFAGGELGAEVLEQRGDGILDPVDGGGVVSLFPGEELRFEFLVDDGDELDFGAGGPVAVEDFLYGEFGFGRSVDADHDLHGAAGLVAMRTDDANGAEGFSGDFVGDAAEEEFFEGVAAVRADDDEVGPPAACFANDAPGRGIAPGRVGDCPAGEKLVEAASAFDGDLLSLVEELDGALVHGDVAGVGGIVFARGGREPDVGKGGNFGLGTV